MLCKTCHYPLKQLSEPRCPECGRGFDPNDPRTFAVAPRPWLTNARCWWLLGVGYPVSYLVCLWFLFFVVGHFEESMVWIALVLAFFGVALIGMLSLPVALFDDWRERRWKRHNN